MLTVACQERILLNRRLDVFDALSRQPRRTSRQQR